MAENKGQEFLREMESDAKTSSNIIESIKGMFYGGYHPDGHQIRAIVEAICDCAEYQFFDERMVEVTIMRLNNELNPKE